jgi:hypothetical protein
MTVAYRLAVKPPGGVRTWTVIDASYQTVVVRPLAESISVPGDDDILRQHWLTARRPLNDSSRFCEC